MRGMDPIIPLQQHPRFAVALRALGQRAEMLDLADGAGHALVVRRRLPLFGDLGYVPRGPAWATEDLEVRARALANLGRTGVRLLEAESPCRSLRAAGFRMVATPAHVAELALATTPETRRAAFAPKWRGHLRQAERARLLIRDEAFDGDPSHWLLAREAGMRRERGYRALPQSVACAFARACPGAARIHSAWEEGEPVAGMLFLLHPPGATYQIGWSGERGRATSAHHLLLAVAADHLAAEGVLRLDLGTLDAEANPGLARFKIGCGARVRPLGGSWLRLPFAGRLASRHATS